MKRLMAGLLVLLISATLSACSSADDAPKNAMGVPKTLRVGIIPNVSPDKQKAQYEPFAGYLSDRLDVKVELFVASDYAGVVEALASKHVDIAYVGGLTYVQAERQVDLTPLVTEVDKDTGTREYESAIVVKQDSDARSVKDLLDSKASFAFGDISSTSGSLYPRMMLVDAGADCDDRSLTSCAPLSRVTFAGGHDAVAQAVANGSADAGGLELRILRRLEADGSVAGEALRVVESRRVMGYPWVARSALGEKAMGQIRAAFESMSDPELLDLMRAHKYAAVTSADYADVRARAEKLGLVTG
ncbi:phosphate/phosphite/phosphonate ABC transporter substrate-binding protein [Streptomyces sp. BB1-1-1]|uniref:phosphate/phosphite/phosphonate ABC transporter substrate-binding protein n=1 Tax=Streptomyces sp. BB1-1-1 TaxID=3074430 RepID=UPI0028777C29|nr:phosphate/phosphite/phosphonate ABC transporter substrate-binding protein [Streptomyces sp. BB1-1-1]WND33492.1 phosphate/phosphite/phosphonate ABC transporter substrate-binding protein [Streptomyces sp. BB1-1-1]